MLVARSAERVTGVRERGDPAQRVGMGRDPLPVVHHRHRVLHRPRMLGGVKDRDDAVGAVVPERRQRKPIRLRPSDDLSIGAQLEVWARRSAFRCRASL